MTTSFSVKNAPAQPVRHRTRGRCGGIRRRPGSQIAHQHVEGLLGVQAHVLAAPAHEHIRKRGDRLNIANRVVRSSSWVRRAIKRITQGNRLGVRRIHGAGDQRLRLARERDQLGWRPQRLTRRRRIGHRELRNAEDGLRVQVHAQDRLPLDCRRRKPVGGSCHCYGIDVEPAAATRYHASQAWSSCCHVESELRKLVALRIHLTQQAKTEGLAGKSVGRCEVGELDIHKLGWGKARAGCLPINLGHHTGFIEGDGRGRQRVRGQRHLAHNIYVRGIHRRELFRSLHRVELDG